MAPQTFQSVVRLNRDTRGREIVMMRWGLIPYWAKDPKIGISTINAKAERVATAPSFREAFRKRRCLVPADAFLEWQKIDAKTRQPFAIALKSGEPYGFAGLWERWRDKASNTELLTFSVITTDPNAVVEHLHNRMPVILPEHDCNRWLEVDSPQLPIDLLRPYEAEQMTAWEVDKRIGDARNDSLDLLQQQLPQPKEPSLFDDTSI